MIKGIEDGTIKPSLGQELIASNSTDTISAPSATPRTALSDQVAKAPEVQPIIVNAPSGSTESSNEQAVADASWAMGLEDSATSHLKNLTYMRLASV